MRFIGTGNFESLGSIISGSVFMLSAVVLVTTTLLYAKRHKPAFREFLVKQGFAAERPELLAVSES
jgi:hypothetical protein